MAAGFLQFLDFPGWFPPDILSITSALHFGDVANGWTVLTAAHDFGIVITPATQEGCCGGTGFKRYPAARLARITLLPATF